MSLKTFVQVDAAGYVVALCVSEIAPCDVAGRQTIEMNGELPPRPDEEVGWRFHLTNWQWEQAAAPGVRAAHAAAVARQDRFARLQECEWTQSPDSPLSPEVKAEWATYRQALRDITLQAGWPFVVNWPLPPGHAG